MESDNSYSIIQGQPSASSSIDNSQSYHHVASQRSVFRPSVQHSAENSELSELPQCDYDDDEPVAEEQINPIEERFEGISLDGAIKLSLRLKKKDVQLSSTNVQTFPMLASLVTDNIPAYKKASVDLVCVIDRSSSMHGDSIELVKETFKYLLQYLDDADRLSIVLFNSEALRLTPLVRTTQEGKQKILSEISTINAFGGTNIALGMNHAFQILNQRRQRNSVASIFLLSDGLDQGAQKKVKSSLTSMLVPDDVTIHTFGFSKHHDPQLMNDIAALRDGSFYFIKELDTIDEAFVDCLGGLISAVAQSVTLKILPVQSEMLQGVEIVKAYGDTQMWDKEGEAYITKFSNLISGRQKDFVLELQIPRALRDLSSQERNIVVAKAEAEIIGLYGNKIIKNVDLHIELFNAEDVKDDDEDEDDREVMKNFYRVKGASIIEEARKLADKNNYDEAKKVLQNFKEELEECALKEEIFVKNLMIDVDNTMKNVDPEVFDNVGKHEMLSVFRAQMHQKSNFGSANCYRNDVQTKMVKEVRDKKNDNQKPFLFRKLNKKKTLND